MHKVDEHVAVSRRRGARSALCRVHRDVLRAAHEPARPVRQCGDRLVRAGDPAAGLARAGSSRPATGFFVALGVYFARRRHGDPRPGHHHRRPEHHRACSSASSINAPAAGRGAPRALRHDRLSLQLKVPLLGMLVPGGPRADLPARRRACALAHRRHAGAASARRFSPICSTAAGAKSSVSVSAFALAYAALSIVLLVALPMSLYMLLAPGPGGPI